ncbi:MAG: hypothetical protein JWN14_3442 [Chthonomonadales bacterium]|nr:hypothetical protein [Chthonomonadales bacterium]
MASRRAPAWEAMQFRNLKADKRVLLPTDVVIRSKRQCNVANADFQNE